MKSIDIIEKNPTILEIDPKTVPEELVTALGPDASSYTSYKVGKTFLSRKRRCQRSSLTCSRPLSEFTGENIQLVGQVISNDPHSTYDEILHETSLSHGTIERIIHDCLKIKKVTSRWAPHQLTHEQRVKLNLASIRLVGVPP